MFRGALEPWHVLVLVLIVVILFGWKKLPDAARSLGRSARILKSELGDDDKNSASNQTVPGQTQPPAGSAPGEAPVPGAAPYPQQGNTGQQQPQGYQQPQPGQPGYQPQQPQQPGGGYQQPQAPAGYPQQGNGNTGNGN